MFVSIYEGASIVRKVEVLNDILEFGMLCEVNKGSKDLKIAIEVEVSA
jgi:hypothetical protein